jgi:hypothetical protein
VEVHSRISQTSSRVYRRAATVTRSESIGVVMVAFLVPVAIALTALGALVSWLVSDLVDEAAKRDRSADATIAAADERIDPPPSAPQSRLRP